jgi:hypothetical protein
MFGFIIETLWGILKFTFKELIYWGEIFLEDIFFGDILMGLTNLKGVNILTLLFICLSIEYFIGELLNLLLFPISLRSSFFSLTKEFKSEIYLIIVGILCASN